MRKPTKTIVFLLILSLVFTLGCGAAKKPAPDYVMPDGKMEQTNDPGGNNFAAQSNPAEVARESENLRQQVRSINGVGDATVVINNSRAIVGIIPSQDYDGKQETLINNIQSRINNNNGKLQEVNVTSEPMLFRQIKGFEGRINNGESPETYAEDLNNISETIKANDNSKGIEQRQ